jgi:hypothetical protein
LPLLTSRLKLKHLLVPQSNLPPQPHNRDIPAHYCTASSH